MFLHEYNKKGDFQICTSVSLIIAYKMNTAFFWPVFTRISTDISIVFIWEKTGQRKPAF